MRNNLFKKVSAAALAAVMALTFAPAASLTALAADNVGVKDGNVLTAASVEINNSGAYTVSGAAAVSKITISGDAVNVSTDLGGNTDHVTLALDPSAANKNGKSINVHIKGNIETKAYDGTISYDKVTIGTGWNVASFGALSFEGNMEVDDNAQAVLTATRNGKLARAFGSTPVVTTSTEAGANSAKYYLGSDVINSIVAGKNNVYAVNGAVEVKGLKDGYTAKIAKNGNAGTTLTATAEDKKSLVEVKTRYTYNFKYDDTEGTSVYTDDMFQAGNGGLALLGTATPTLVDAQTIINTKSLAVSPTSITAVADYDKAVTITENENNKFAKSVHVPYVDAHSYDDDSANPGYHKGINGITYFTADPTSYVDAYDGIALMDGTKYIIDRKSVKETSTLGDKELSQLELSSARADKTLQILKGTSESGLAVDDYNEITCSKDVKVTAPKTSTVAIAETVTVGTKYSTPADFGYVFGANHVEGVANKGFFSGASATRGNKLVETYLVVPQVADGAYAIVNDGYTDTKVTVGDGITYFYHEKLNQIAGDHATFVFGKTADASKALTNVLVGTSVGGTNYFNKAVAGETVYAAKELKGKFKNVNPQVTVKGEISAVPTAQTNGKYTWTLNEGYASDAVTAYRMYRKSGEHVYTINPDEVSMLVNAGWINEGPAFIVNSVASKTGTPVYRVYNRNNGGMHFYTANAAEKDMLLQNGWTEGAVVFYGAEKATGIPVYRTYNTGSNNGEHNYTTNIKEADMNVQAGWRAEGVAFYVFK